MSEELKPCPFCGSTDLSKAHRNWNIKCNNCAAEGPWNSEFDADKAASDWNSRAQPSDGALTNEGAEPVYPYAYAYEWASWISTEGPKDFKLLIEREPPPEWAVEEGQARNVVSLFRAKPAPASVVLPNYEDYRAFLVNPHLEKGTYWGWNACLDRVKELNS